MAGFVFLSFLIVSCLLFPCEGKVFAPSAGSTLTFARNSAESRIVWSFDDTIDPTTRRTWSFTPTGQSPVVLAIIDSNGPVRRFSNLLEFSIEEPATLVLENLNLTYNGAYQFTLSPSIGVGSSEVVVFIAAQPPASFKIFLNGANLVSTENTYTIPEVNVSHVGNYTCVAKNILGNKTSNSKHLFLMELEVTPTVKVDCLNPSTVNVTDNFTCICTVSGGNPPADVAWYKENKKIGDSELRLINVSRNDAGMYRCEAKSHESAINTTEIELIVNYPPENVQVTVTRSGKSATITCSAEAQPPASFKIFLDQTNPVSTDKTYTIPDVNVCNVANYTCVVKNILGSKTSNSRHLVSLEETRTTKAPITNNLGRGECDNCGTKWYVVVGSMMSGIIIGLFLACISFCARRRWFTIKKPERHVKPGTTQVDSTYQELDLTKMNKEDNYQSLRMNAASNDAANDDDSNYAELSKTRESDVENNYQSLT